MTTCSKGCVTQCVEVPLVSHQFAKFRGHRSCGSSDTAAKIFYVILQDCVIKGSGDFMEGNSSLYIPTLPKLIGTDIVLMDIHAFFYKRQFDKQCQAETGKKPSKCYTRPLG